MRILIIYLSATTAFLTLCGEPHSYTLLDLFVWKAIGVCCLGIAAIYTRKELKA